MARRFERARPGELVHMDVKKAGRIPDGDEWRAYGRTGVTYRKRKGGNAFGYIRLLVDDHAIPPQCSVQLQLSQAALQDW